MSLPRVRLTVRQLMAAVAVVALLAWCFRLAWHSDQYARLSRQYLQDAALFAKGERMSLEKVKKGEMEVADTVKELAGREKDFSDKRIMIGYNKNDKSKVMLMEEYIKNSNEIDELNRNMLRIMRMSLGDDREEATQRAAMRRYYQDLGQKYRSAARSPWLLAEPDPPPTWK